MHAQTDLNIHHVTTQNGTKIPVTVKQYANADNILKKIQYAIDHIEPQSNLSQILAIKHFAGCSNHACEMKLNNGKSVFLRIPGDNPQTLDNRDERRTEGVFVNRAMEESAISAIEECNVNGQLTSEVLEEPPFHFHTKDKNAGFKVEPFTPDCKTLEGRFDNQQIRAAALEILHKFHSQQVLDTWKAKISVEDQNLEYDILHRIEMMLHGMDAIYDDRPVEAKQTGNPFRVIGGKDIYDEGRTGVHVGTSGNVTTYTVLPTRTEIRDIVAGYKQLEEKMGAKIPDGCKRLCHNDLSSANYMISEEKLANPATQDIAVIDFEFAAKNDPMCDIAYLISEEKSLATEENIIALLKEYHAEEEISEEQFQNELNRIAFYMPLIDMKVAVWSSYQVLLNNESSNIMGLTKTWGIDRWNSFLKTLDNSFVQVRFKECGLSEQLNLIRDDALTQTKVAKFNTGETFRLFDSKAKETTEQLEQTPVNKISQ